MYIQYLRISLPSLCSNFQCRWLTSSQHPSPPFLASSDRAFIIKRNGGHFLSPRQTSRPRRRTRGETQCHQRIIEHSSSNPLMIQRSPSNTPFEIPQEDSSRRFPLTARGETFRYQELLLHPSSSEPRSRGAELLDNEIYRRHLRREERRRLRASLRECRGREIDDEGRRQGNGEEDDGLVGNSQTNLMIPISGDSRNTQKNELPAYSIDFGLPKYPIIASTSQSRSSRRINGTNDSIIHSGLGNEHQIELVNEDSNGVEEGEEIGNSNTTSEQGASGMIQSPPPPPSYGS